MLANNIVETQVPKELPSDLHSKIVDLCDIGDNLSNNQEHDSALRQYNKAWELLPDPKHDWEAATWVLSAMGDCCFFKGEFVESLRYFSEAMRCPNAIGNPFIHLRLGES